VAKNEQQNGLISRMPFSESYKLMVNKDAFVGFRGIDRPNRPPLDRPLKKLNVIETLTKLLYCSEEETMFLL